MKDNKTILVLSHRTIKTIFFFQPYNNYFFVFKFHSSVKI